MMNSSWIVLQKTANSSRPNPHLVQLTILFHRKYVSIQQNPLDAPADVVRVLNADLVLSGSKAVVHF
jgi:hypothetical protein